MFRRVVLVAASLVVVGCAGGGEAPSEVSLLGTNSLDFEPEELRVAAGIVEFELTSEEGAEHTLVIDELDDELVVRADAGETATGQAELAAGTFTLYCDVPGHREAGMEATLTVEE